MRAQNRLWLSIGSQLTLRASITLSGSNQKPTTESLSRLYSSGSASSAPIGAAATDAAAATSSGLCVEGLLCMAAAGTALFLTTAAATGGAAAACFRVSGSLRKPYRAATAAAAPVKVKGARMPTASARMPPTAGPSRPPRRAAACADWFLSLPL